MHRIIRYLFFDVGDTLRITTDIPEHRLAAKRRVCEILGVDADPVEYAALIDKRYEEYRNWATNSWVELPEAELWTKWLVPDIPAEKVIPHGVELTFLFRQFRGYRVTAPGAMEMTKELTRRGYHLGIISNVITSQELPDWIEEDGFGPYFSPVVLSSLTGIRKPDPEIFRIALRRADISPEFCAYIGDNVERDMGGANAVGFGMKILIDHKGKGGHVFDDNTRPDAIIGGCLDLLDLFPSFPYVNEASKLLRPPEGVLRHEGA